MSRPTRRFPTRADLIHSAWERIIHWADLGPSSRRAQRFARFGEGSVVVFPPTVVHGEARISIGEGTTVGPQVTLSAGMPGHPEDGSDPAVVIGDRCVIGKGSGIVAHESVTIGDDTWTGHHVYVTDQNHGYEDVTRPVGTQMWKNAPVRIGPDCWLGHGALILPGTTLGRHVVVGAGAVVAGIQAPDYSVVAGVPARVVRRYHPDEGWVPVPPAST